MQAATAAPTPDQQWWGHSKQHGWVVLDRSIAGNGPGTKQTLFFMRCKDMTTFTITRTVSPGPKSGVVRAAASLAC